MAIIGVMPSSSRSPMMAMFFMRILCINIDSDTESWDASVNEFERFKVDVERLPAVVGDNRVLAFNQSVYKAMKRAEGDSLMLFEDDVTFERGVEAWQIPWQELPDDFMTLHLGANIIGTDTMQWQMPTPYSANLVKLHNCWQSHATIYSAECVQFIIDNMRTDVVDEDNNCFDDWLRRKVLSQGRSYLLRSMIAWQRPRHSAIWNVAADYTGCHKQGNEWLKNNIR